MNKFIAKHNGEIVGRRTSKDRTYTHCVAFIPSYDVALAHVTSDAARAYEARDWDYMKACVDGSKPIYDMRYMDVYRLAVEQGSDAYVQGRLDRAAAAIEAKKAEGYYSTMQVATWCGRRDLAEKEYRSRVGSKYLSEVAILEAVKL